jgi:hypothetical protein
MAYTPWEEQRHTSSHGIHKATRQLCGPTGYCARSDRLTGQCITHWVLRVRGLHVANGGHRHWLNWPSRQPDRRRPKCPLLSLCQLGVSVKLDGDDHPWHRWLPRGALGCPAQTLALVTPRAFDLGLKTLTLYMLTPPVVFESILHSLVPLPYPVTSAIRQSSMSSVR